MQVEERTTPDAQFISLPRTGSWTLPLVALGTLILATGFLYREPIAAALTVWWVSPTFSHCYLIVPISGWLIWRQRHELAKLTPAPYPQALLLALPLIGASIVGMLMSVNEIQQLALIGYIQVLALALLGPQIYRRILFACIFLFFLVPTGEYLIVPLQGFTTKFVASGLRLIGVPFHLEGYTLELANGVYQIAEACAGLRFLIATIAVGALFVHFTYSKWYKIVLYLVASAIVPVIANGFRALGIVLLAHWSGNRIAVGTDHLVYGWGFSVAILVFLMYVGSRFADPSPEEKHEGEAAGGKISRSGLVAAAVAGAVAVSAAPAFAYWHDRSLPEIDPAALAIPSLPAGWASQAMISDWSPHFAEPDAKLEFAMKPVSSSASPPADVFVYYYAGRHGGRDLISSTNKIWDEDVWHPVSGVDVNAHLGRAPVRFRELEIVSYGGEARLVWWTYWTNDRFTTSGMQVKLDKLRTAFSGHPGGALIAVSTLVNVDMDVARARLLDASRELGGISAKLDAVADGSRAKQ